MAKRAEMELADREAVKKAATEREEQDRREKEAAAQKREAEVEDTSIADGSRSIGTQVRGLLRLNGICVYWQGTALSSTMWTCIRMDPSVRGSWASRLVVLGASCWSFVVF